MTKMDNYVEAVLCTHMLYHVDKANQSEALLPVALKIGAPRRPPVDLYLDRFR